jgi:hypothetical protein
MSNDRQLKDEAGTIQVEVQEEDTIEVTRTDLSGDAVAEISGFLRQLLADVFVLYLKTKNFHWHMSGRHFRDYHLLLDGPLRTDIRNDRRYRGTSPQDRRPHPSLYL